MSDNSKNLILVRNQLSEATDVEMMQASPRREVEGSIMAGEGSIRSSMNRTGGGKSSLSPVRTIDERRLSSISSGRVPSIDEAGSSKTALRVSKLTERRKTIREREEILEEEEKKLQLEEEKREEAVQSAKRAEEDKKMEALRRILSQHPNWRRVREAREREAEDERIRTEIREAKVLDTTIQASAAVTPRMLRVFKYIGYESLSPGLSKTGKVKPWTKKERIAHGLAPKPGAGRFGGLPKSFLRAKQAA